MTNKVITGSKGGSSTPHQPQEMEDNLISINKIKVLLAISDGEIDESFDLKQLMLNSVPVQNQDGSFNYEGVTAQFRSGTQTQEYIKGMEDSASEVTVNHALKTDTPYSISVTNKTLSAIRIKMFMATGMKIEDNGDKVGVRVEYEVQQAVDGGSFETVLSDVIDGKTTTGYDRSRRINLPSFNNQVILRVVRKTPDSTDSNTIDEITVRSYAEVIDAKFRYPLTGLLYVEFDSKMFPSQIPTISVRKKLKIINVPSNYDPVSRTYTGTWDGVFKKAWSNNPAWVLYDIITNQRYGLDQKELGINVDKWSLYEAAQYCDQMVPDGKGGTEPRYLCDVVLQSQTDAYRIVSDICSIFRGMSFWNGESISVVIDRPREPAYVFTNDNVINGDFTYTLASEKTMYTTCNVTFDDEQNMYQQDVEPVFDHEATLRFGNNVTSITAIGCTRRSEANRRGRWILKTNLRSTTVSFATGLEGMIPMIGDVVAISDNFWSSNLTLNLSGRVLEVSGLQVFTPFRIDARPGDFIIINKPDGKPVKRTIANVSADGKTIELNTGFGFSVPPNSVFAIERTDLALQLYVLTKIEKGDDDEEFTYKITAVEYDPNKYDEIDYGVNIDDRPTSIVEPDQLPRPRNVTVTSESRIVQGMSVETMTVGWDKAQYASLYDVQWRKNNGNWQNTPQTASTETSVEGIYAGNYHVRVRSVSSSGSTSGWSDTASASLTGKDGEPGAPINMTATDDVVFGIRTKWGFAAGSGDTAYTELQQSPDGTADNASLLTMVPYPQYEYYHSPMPGGHVVWYRARTVDRIGNVSPWTDFVRGMASTDVDSIIGEIEVDIENSPGFKWLEENATESAAQIIANAEAAIENALANNADVLIMRKENGKRKAEYIKSIELVADETQARVTAIESLKAQIDDEITAQIVQISQALATESEARASADLALSARIGDTEAAITQKLDAWTNADSTGAMYGVKLGLRYNGQEYSAGMAMSLIGSGSSVKSQVLFEAGRFAISTSTSGSGPSQYPFVVEGSQVILNSAIIKDGFITNAMIGNVIQSNNWDGNNGWNINKNGNASFMNATVRGSLYANNGNFAFNGTSNTVQINGNGITVNLPNGGRVVVGTW